jgi:hypothetical protein
MIIWELQNPDFCTDHFVFDFSVHKDTYEKLAKDQCKIQSQHYLEIVYVQVLDYIDNIHKAFCIGIPTACGH